MRTSTAVSGAGSIRLAASRSRAFRLLGCWAGSTTPAGDRRPPPAVVPMAGMPARSGSWAARISSRRDSASEAQRASRLVHAQRYSRLGRIRQVLGLPRLGAGVELRGDGVLLGDVRGLSS